ncbi:hypothetical protein KM546_gp38 [Porcine lymphotropic herpesvirus 3]|uniref:Uncharacterized protein n=1 Tax=Suid gammaherpesvirus 5 TaxID=1960251 RepID=Q8B3Y0_9GAMA|nr:hypothetical protein KM546_gp38 [Porcine lymphotropic herpesvirus 3]AAO12345.1 unknown [Porcine lymphotropic herpesvirus 3]
MELIMSKLCSESHMSTDVVYQYPIIPRLVLEVSRNQNICVASNSPVFVDSNGNLNIKDLDGHVKARLNSPHFVGFTICSILTCEDKVLTLDIFQHVLKERCFLYKPDNFYLAELCILLSAIENMVTPSLKLILQCLRRARFIHTRCSSVDATFLLHGIEVLLSTMIDFYSFEKDETEHWAKGLDNFNIYKAVQSFDPTCKDLISAMFCSSHRLEEETGAPKEPQTKQIFNLFYCPTFLTHHYSNKYIIKFIKLICIGDIVKFRIFSK